MFNREGIETREYQILSVGASKSRDSLGRDVWEEDCELRTKYMRDRDRIIHSKAFRRLMHKTQVFIASEKDHFRTRLTHTIEVSQIARTIGRALLLNEDLIDAIALGHDLGHTPFGHNGEESLAQIHPGGFRHNTQSLRVVEILEGTSGPNGRGMNLTKEVRDGILNHNGKGIPFTLEGQVVKTSDRIAYINHDIDDAIRSGELKDSDLPKECVEYLGLGHSQRVNTMVMDMVENSWNKKSVCMSEECGYYTNVLREFMFENVYLNESVKKEADLEWVNSVIQKLYEYYLKKPEELPEEHFRLLDEYGVAEVVKDYVAGMTDRYAQRIYSEKIARTRLNRNK
jgi:dGTPase